MNQNSGTASQAAHSSQCGDDVDVSAKGSCCQSSVSWSNVVQSPETQLWCMSTDSFLTQRILPAYNKMSHVKFVYPAVNSSKIEVPYLKSKEETLEKCFGAVCETVCISHQNFDSPLCANVKSGLNWLNEFRLVNGMNLSRMRFSVAALVCDLEWEDIIFHKIEPENVRKMRHWNADECIGVCVCVCVCVCVKERGKER